MGSFFVIFGPFLKPLIFQNMDYTSLEHDRECFIEKKNQINTSERFVSNDIAPQHLKTFMPAFQCTMKGEGREEWMKAQWIDGYLLKNFITAVMMDCSRNVEWITSPFKDLGTSAGVRSIDCMSLLTCHESWPLLIREQSWGQRTACCCFFQS